MVKDFSTQKIFFRSAISDDQFHHFIKFWQKIKTAILTHF